MVIGRRDFLRTGFLAASVLGLSKGAAAYSLPYKRPDLLQQVENASVQLFTAFSKKDGQVVEISQGSGTVFKSKNGHYYISTNWHVTSNKDYSSKGYKSSTYIPYGPVLDTSELIVNEPSLDLSILRTATDLSYRVLADYRELLNGNSRPAKGDSLLVIGYRNGIYGWRPGSVLNIEESHNYPVGSHACIKCVSTAWKGNSGSAVLKMEEKSLSWVGIYHASVSLEEDLLKEEDKKIVKALEERVKKEKLRIGYAVLMSQLEPFLQAV